MRSQDLTADLQQQILQAIAKRKSLRIVGGGSKAFYGGYCQADAVLNVAGHAGVVEYEPSESVITVRAGSCVQEVADMLAEQRQMLGFEPPDYAGQATVGGTLACGFSGPRRPFAGSARDAMLGCKVINGYGEILHFGGQVMKNVAGFDVSRLMVGALGSLGLLLEVSLRVLPMPERESTIAFALPEAQAIEKMQQLSAQPWPLSAVAYDGELLRIRLSSAEAAVRAAALRLCGTPIDDDDQFWRLLREQRLPFFSQPGDLWRISVPPATPSLALSGKWLLDWGGALRWLKTDRSADAIHAMTRQSGGYALRYRGVDKSDWMRLDTGLLALQQNIRRAFDPHLLFNPGRLLP